jgi:hypothetical protein
MFLVSLGFRRRQRFLLLRQGQQFRRFRRFRHCRQRFL